MPMSLSQRLRLWLQGRERRREERDRNFLATNASWGGATATKASAPESARAVARAEIDRDGLQSAYLDQSGRIGWYLDTETGEVLDVRDGGELEPPRYRRVPTQSDEDDRRAFAATLDDAAQGRLAASRSFREWLASDRTLERAFYNFKTRRAIDAIEAWLASIGAK